MADISRAISAINPNAKFSMQDASDYNSIDWEDTPVISKEDIDAKIEELNASEENEKVAKENLKASVKAKLIAGEKLTEEEANILVGV